MEIDSVNYLKFFFALLFVIGLIGVFALVARKIGLGNFGANRHGNGSRLSMIESLQIDAKRKLVLIRCDEKGHLLLLGGAIELLIKADIPIDFTKKTIEKPKSSKPNFMQKFLDSTGNKKNE